MTRRLLDRVVRRFDLPRDIEERAQRLLDTEWLVTNGLGGYSSSTLAGLITRRYHGVLVAALPNPIGRMVMLNHLGERLVVDGRATSLTNEERAGGRADHAVAAIVTDVRLEGGLPVWEYAWEGIRIEKRVLMPYRQNTVHVTYRLLDGPAGAVLELLPARALSRVRGSRRYAIQLSVDNPALAGHVERRSPVIGGRCCGARCVSRSSEVAAIISSRTSV